MQPLVLSLNICLQIKYLGKKGVNPWGKQKRGIPPRVISHLKNISDFNLGADESVHAQSRDREHGRRGEVDPDL